MDSRNPTSQVVFFLGAGASVPAGVPDTHSFVTKFLQDIREPDSKATVGKIIDTLEQWKGTKIDVELLLETLTKLDTKKEEPLLRFFGNIEDDFILKGYPEKEPIIQLLKDFIRKKAIIKSTDKIAYLKPLLGFVGEFQLLDIISVNYDTCIEHFCNLHKLTYRDGFDVYWNPRSFDADNTDIRLYKIHGSVIWYRSDRGGYLKIPVMSKDSNVELFTGEKAESLMLYPMQKWDYAEPLLELLVEIKKRIESPTCQFLIIIGYSFRDEHIRRMLWDVARKNKELNIILVDPQAYDIYSNKLKYYPKGRIPSSLDGRVICLPYKFEIILPHLKDYFVKKLLSGLTCAITQRERELKGEVTHWMECLRDIIDAGFLEKAEDVASRIKDYELRPFNLEYLLTTPFKLGVTNAIAQLDERASGYLDKFRNNFLVTCIDTLHAETNGPLIEFRFHVPDKTGEVRIFSFSDVEEIVKSLHNYLTFHLDKLELRAEHIYEFKKVIDNVRDHFARIKGAIHVEDYARLREEHAPGVRDALLNVNRHEVTRFIAQTEQKIMKKIIYDIDV